MGGIVLPFMLLIINYIDVLGGSLIFPHLPAFQKIHSITTIMTHSNMLISDTLALQLFLKIVGNYTTLSSP